MLREAAPVDLRSLVSETIEGLQVQARQHGNRLSVAFVGDQQHSVMGDATRLEQIVVNLVGNAIKFTENGAIHVDLNRSAGGGRIELRVTDTGIGIAEQDLDRIFDEFVTLGATFDRRVQGTGLGLSIVKGLIDAMGGEIDVVSEPGAGTAFHVSLDLPLAEAVAVPSFAGTPAGLSCAGLTVLVVEDNEINRLVAGEMLCQSGCQVVEAEDGVEGVAAAGRRPFDLILMDISMPRLNGVDATRAIRAGGPNRKTPIVALTAHATPEDLARFRAAGMEDSLTKPLRRADLVATLAGAAATQAPAPDRHTSDDLVQCLGEAQARVLTDRVLMEIRDGLDRLARGDAGASSDGAALAHRLAGSAAVAGLRDLHQGLISLEQGLRAGGHGAAPRHLTAPLIAILEKLSVKSSLKPARDARQA